jgi:hypothetical protein
MIMLPEEIVHILIKTNVKAVDTLTLYVDETQNNLISG